MRARLRRLRPVLTRQTTGTQSGSIRPGLAAMIGVLAIGLMAVSLVVVAHAHAAARSLPTRTKPVPTVTVHTSAAAAITPSRPHAAAQPRVPRPHHLIDATLMARQDHTLRSSQLRALRQIDGVRRVMRVSAGPALVDGHRARVIGVNPTTFRAWTPRLTAMSNPLWRSVAGGELTASFDMGKGAKLPLGGTVPVRAHHSAHPSDKLRIGAFASVGMAGVDAVVDPARARAIGLPQHNAVVISAPNANPLVLRAAVSQVLGHGAATTLLREVVIVRDAGEFLTRTQISTALHAAASRIGKPYVWGATGPNSFDCSGLVQWSFAHAGITMPRVSQEQFFAGPHVSYANARPGDLLFWHYDPTDPTDVDHVAIYAGNGMMIVAPHTGLNVEYVPVPLDHLAGVVRVDPAISSQVG